MTSRIEVLVVDDNSIDRRAVQRLLENGFVFLEAATAREGIATARARLPACVFLDYRLPDQDGLGLIPLFTELGIPVIMLTGQGAEDIAVAAVKAGASDYLSKDRLDARVLAKAISHAIEKKSLHAKLQAQEERFRLILDASPDALVITAADGLISIVNQEAERLFGYAREELVGQPVETLIPVASRGPHVEQRADFMRAPQRRQVNPGQPLQALRRNGTLIPVEVSLSPIKVGEETLVCAAVRDVTQRLSLERQLIAAQRMEAVGRLAGGVAHDFNNILTAILSFSKFVVDDLKPGDASHEDMQEVIHAAERAARLTRQLLAFSRQQAVDPVPLNLNATVADIDRMLRRVLGEDIEFTTALEDGLWNVTVDPTAIEQVIVNLAVNARDAMRHGGRLTLQTQNVVLDSGQETANSVAIPAGEYVLICVSDEGEGIDADVQGRIFEPFFTTKGDTGGTGLGLATCYGIVAQAAGFIDVESEKGAGTTFRVYLPRTADKVVSVPAPPAAESLGGTETILVAEDNNQVRALVIRTLKRRGYAVLEAADGAIALSICETHEGPIHLLVTDLVMPQLGGAELAERVATTRPDMKVLYMSGYSETSVLPRGMLGAGRQLIQKPFTPDVLSVRVREALNATSARPAPA